MADSSKLLLSLQEYLRQIDLHSRQMAAEFQQLELAYMALSQVYEGSTAENFRSRWSITMTHFEQSADHARKLRAIIEEKIAAMKKAENPELH